jgi:hypothetical protein
MKFFFINIILFITLVSCDKFDNKVIFENNSNKEIDSVLVIGNPLCNPLKFKKIKPNEKMEGKLLNCTQIGGDGSYHIKVFTNDSLIEKVSGYYTNGYPIFFKMYIRFDKNNNITLKEDNEIY